MNKFTFPAFLVLSIAFASCGGETTSTTSDDSSANDSVAITTENVEAKTTIAFEEAAFDFGKITQGEKVEHTFKFTNTGNEPLVVVSAKGSCGCTVPQWPKEPVAPGASGEIFVVFNSEGKSGTQHKQVSIVANTEPATTFIAISGEVIAPDAAAASAAPAK